MERVRTTVKCTNMKRAQLKGPKLLSLLNTQICEVLVAVVVVVLSSLFWLYGRHERLTTTSQTNLNLPSLVYNFQAKRIIIEKIIVGSQG